MCDKASNTYILHVCNFRNAAMDSSQYETLAHAIETHVIDLFVRSLKNVSTFLAYSIGYWVFGMILAWVRKVICLPYQTNNQKGDNCYRWLGVC